jgi:hypothetical protein
MLRVGVEDADEVTDGSHISQADDHVGQFRTGQPDTAARRKPALTGQLIGRAEHDRRTGGRRFASRVSDHEHFAYPGRAPKRYP